MSDIEREKMWTDRYIATCKFTDHLKSQLNWLSLAVILLAAAVIYQGAIG